MANLFEGRGGKFDAIGKRAVDLMDSTRAKIQEGVRFRQYLCELDRHAGSRTVHTANVMKWQPDSMLYLIQVRSHLFHQSNKLK